MKTVLIVLAVIIVAGGVGFVVLNNQDDSETAAPNQAAQQENTDQQSNEQTDGESNFDPDPNNYTDGANIGETIDATGQSEVTIMADDFIFATTFLKIDKGTKVTWINNGNIGHDVTSASSSPKGGLGSPLLSNGDSYEFIFDEAGIYEYFCTPHPTEMRGVITVVE